jgi:hypothetical protein
MRWAWARQPVLTDADGRFILSKLAPGKYLVRAYRKGGGEAVAEHVEVGTAVALVIKPTGTIGGTVSIAGQAPPQQFSIAVVDDAQGIEVRETFWRTEGAWSLHELPAGQFKVNAAAREGEARETAALADGQTRDGLRLELKPRASLRGRLVALDNGKPVPRMRMMAQLPSAGGNFFSNADADGERKNISDVDGRFQVDDAPVGRILVFGYPVEYDDSEFDFCMTRTSLQAGQELELPPIRCARRRLKGSRDNGGDLGFTLKQVNPAAVADPIPLVVAVVRPGGPAAMAGLKVKDVITSIDGQDLTGVNDYFFWTLSQVPVGTTVALGLAGGKTLSIIAGAPP